MSSFYIEQAYTSPMSGKVHTRRRPITAAQRDNVTQVVDELEVLRQDILRECPEASIHSGARVVTSR